MGIITHVLVSFLYMMVGPSLVILNKHILSDVGFEYPMLLSSLGLLFAAVSSHVLDALGVINIGKRQTVNLSFWFYRILPVGACHAATLAFGNAQYLYMGVALIQFLKAFTPIVVTIFSVILLGQRPSMAVVACLITLCACSATTAAADLRVNAHGLMLAAASASTEAVRLVLTQYVLQDCRFTLWESQYYLAPAAAFCLVSVGWWYEGERLMESQDLMLVYGNPLIFIGAASLGIGVQLLTAAVIQGPGAVTLKVLSQIRNAALVLVGVVLFGEEVSGFQVAGYVASMVAFGFYSYLNFKASSSAPNKTRTHKAKLSPRT